LNDGASLDYYKFENINDFSSIYTNVNFTLGKDSALKTFGLSLNGQITSNKINVTFTQRGASADLNGLYLIDKQQKSSTEVKVMHCSPDCTSRQLFKGIADDVSQADFQGHIFVDYGAKGTEALQSSKNMQLTDKAKVNTQPFLEIYNDDVKCSHGATVGQLDKEALFYLKSRGISDRSAKMLLMYAFCEEVLAKSDIVELKESLGDLILRPLSRIEKLESELELKKYFINPYNLNDKK
jgi:Fe-S cluster assembly protein SufD